MNNLFWLALGFFIAIGLGFILMPVLGYSLVKAQFNQNNSTQKMSPKLIGIFLLVPIVAGLLYAKLGSPKAPSISSASEAMPAAMPQNMSSVDMNGNHEMGDFNAMAAKLAAKLEKNPSDGEGWALLARSYVELKQHKDAVPAFEKAIKLLPADPQLLADYVDARAMTQNHQLDDQSAELIKQALKLDPNLPKALMLEGTMAFDHQDYKKAISIWEHLQGSLKSADAPEMLNEITINIAAAQAAMAKK